MQQLNVQSCNPVNNYARNNNRPLVVSHCNTEENKNSFFLRTAVDWNRLENNVVHVSSLENFKTMVVKARQLCTVQVPCCCNNARHGHNLQSVPHAKYLGVTISDGIRTPTA